MPPYQRKLEGVVRVILNALNMHPDYHNAKFTILWRSLTIMEPQVAKEHDPDHIAIAQVDFPLTPTGEMKCQVTIMKDSADKLGYHTAENPEEDLWTTSWNKQWWGRQMEEDDLDRAAATGVVDAANTPQKGKGKSARRSVGVHWTKGFTTTSYENPFPLELEWSVVTTPQTIEYDRREYNTKMGRWDLNSTTQPSKGDGKGKGESKGDGKGAGK